MRAVLCDENGDFVARNSAPIDREAKTAQTNVDIVVSVIESIVEDIHTQPRELGCIVLGVPGTTDPEKGLVMLSPNVPYWANIPLKSMLEERLGVTVALENDVNLAAVGEHWKGSATGCSNFFFLALGTGIGGGVFVDGQLYRGTHFSAGEVGYCILHPEQGSRRLGDLGWLESIASGLGIQRSGRRSVEQYPDSYLGRAAGSGRGVSPEMVFEAADQGDPNAKRIVDEATHYLGLAVVNITALLDPELIVLGGGVSRQGEVILGPVRESARGHGINVPPLRVSKLGDQAQLYGAVYTTLQYRATAE